MNTFMEKNETIERKWYVIDAEGISLGRVATKAATVLRGKHKRAFLLPAEEKAPKKTATPQTPT